MDTKHINKEAEKAYEELQGLSAKEMEKRINKMPIEAVRLLLIKTYEIESVYIIDSE